MSNSESSTLVGVFTEPAQLDRAIEALQRAGFHTIQFAGPGTSQSSIKRVFPEQGATTGSILDALVVSRMRS
jgi:hypothetical protein